jgi:signal transduction histidine kinase
MEGWLARALSGVERVLDLARSVELRPKGADPEQVDVGAVLQLALRIVRGELRRGADVELDIRDVPKVRGDAGKLGQVILNLLVNALEAVTTANGHGVITVRLSSAPGVVRLDVIDNGPTFAPDDLASVFDPFRRAGKCPRGGGLGLAISKTLVEEMGGKLNVEALPKGALFRVSLPESEPRG